MSGGSARSAPAAAEAPISRRLVGFLRLLRGKGFNLGMGEGLDALRLARSIDLARPRQLRWGLRALLCSSEADWHRFDELFDGYWLGRGRRRLARVADAKARRPGRPEIVGGPSDRPGQADRLQALTDDAGAGTAMAEGASAAEALAKTDFRHIDDAEELAQIYRLTERLAARMRYRLSRRQRQSPRGRRLDLRNTIHNSMAFGGTPIRLAFRRRRVKPLKLVVILDVSGSMSLYSTFFLHFLHGVIDNFREADAFALHTRLVDLGPALRERDMARAVEHLALISAGWSGGTRIGASLATFNRYHAPTVLHSRSVVMIVSDGYDTGPPELLAGELVRLKRRVRRLIWLNPMIGWRDYRPVARGMAAAMPHIDLFAPAHNLESLLALESYLAKI